MKTRGNPTKLTEIATTTEGYLKSFDGTKIWYRSVGKGPPILCCNGLGCSTFYFKYLEHYFKNQYQVISWDYRGHGRSETPQTPSNHTIHSLVRDLKAVMNQFKLKKAILLAHSMGVQIVYEFLKQYPQRVQAIIACFGTYGKPMDTFYNTPLSKYAFEVIYIFNHLFPKLSNLFGTFMAKNPFWFQLGGIFKLMKPYMVDKEVLKEYVEHITQIDPIFLAKLTRSMQEHSVEDYLQKIRIPNLIFGGEEDTFTPVWVSKKMHHLIPKSELFVVKKGSHVALIEQPELINLRIEKFLLDHSLAPRHRQRKSKILKDSIAIKAAQG